MHRPGKTEKRKGEKRCGKTRIFHDKKTSKDTAGSSRKKTRLKGVKRELVKQKRTASELLEE